MAHEKRIAFFQSWVYHFATKKKKITEWGRYFPLHFSGVWDTGLQEKSSIWGLPLFFIWDFFHETSHAFIALYKVDKNVLRNRSSSPLIILSCHLVTSVDFSPTESACGKVAVSLLFLLLLFFSSSANKFPLSRIQVRSLGVGEGPTETWCWRGWVLSPVLTEELETQKGSQKSSDLFQQDKTSARFVTQFLGWIKIVLCL